MKTLYLLRHAKSSWESLTQVDFERPLNKRGCRVAPLIGEFMRDQHFVPDFIVSSPALRARQTAEMVKDAAGFATEITFDARIYEASAKDLLFVLNEMFVAANKLLLVGHNPGIEDLIKVLTGETRAMVTAALAEIELQIDDWKNIYQADGKLRSLFEPKEIADKI